MYNKDGKIDSSGGEKNMKRVLGVLFSLTIAFIVMLSGSISADALTIYRYNSGNQVPADYGQTFTGYSSITYSSHFIDNPGSGLNSNIPSNLYTKYVPESALKSSANFGKIWWEYKNAITFYDKKINVRFTAVSWNNTSLRYKYLAARNPGSMGGFYPRNTVIKVTFYDASTGSPMTIKANLTARDFDGAISDNNIEKMIIQNGVDYVYLGADLTYSGNTIWNSTGGDASSSNTRAYATFCVNGSSFQYTYTKGGYCGFNKGASFIPTQKHNFYVRYHGNGGSGSMPNQTFTYGVSQKIYKNTFTRTGYTFTGWKVHREYDNTWAWASGKGNGKYWQSGEPWGNDIRLYSDGTSISATTYYGWVDMYAQWKINNYTLTYDANGGSVSPASKTLTYGAQYGTLPTPTRKGYTFDGWYTSASGGSKVSSSTTMGASNTTIYAHWTNHKPEFSPSINGTNPDGNVIPPFFNENGLLVIQKNDKFTPINYISVTDKEDGTSIKNQIKIQNNVPLNNGKAYQSGEYDVIYSVTDEGGAYSSYTLKVIVNEPPVISPTNRTFFVGQKVDASELLRKATATDKEDGNISNKVKIVKICYDSYVDKNVSMLDTSKTGLFEIEYTVTDNYKKTVNAKANIKIVTNQSITNSEKTENIRFINNEHLDTLNPASIWNEGDYRNVLNASLNDTTPEQYSKQKIATYRE